MKLIESKAKFVPQKEGLEEIYRQIELCGRTCYKSEDKITNDSAKDFVKRMVNNKHTAMLEHGTVYLIIKWWQIFKFFKYLFNPYTKVHKFKYITTNYRVLVEHNWLEDLKYIHWPTEYHERRYTMKFTCDRGVSHELVRQRKFSFAQESTRYCNYSKSKFNSELTFICPSWLTLNTGIYSHTVTNEIIGDGYIKEGINNDLENLFIKSCLYEEATYMSLLNKGCTPQQARQVLPNALKTEICMTGFASDWRFFFDLRYYGETGKPHPDMELLASKARNEFIKNYAWDNIMKYPTKFYHE